MIEHRDCARRSEGRKSMKLIHLSDLHLGKRVNGFSMLEDQEYIFREILRVIDSEAPDGVLIAGDIYDKPIPPAEAVELFDEFLVGLARRGLTVFLISGNHDSPERLAFGGRLIDASGIHIAPVYDGTVSPYILRDEFGEVGVYLLPFVRPAHVRRFFPDDPIASYTDAVRTAIEQMNIDPARRNVLVTHQFVTGAESCESEELSVGGEDNVDGSVFDAFDYVALGHLHGAQNVGGARIRYCGTPLKYSFSEARHKKSVTVAQLGAKGELSVRTVGLTPLRELAELRGTYQDLTLRSAYENTSLRDDYVRITLTDEQDIPDAVGKLRAIYRNLMKLDYDNTRTRSGGAFSAPAAENRTPLELFSDFYRQQNGAPMSDEQEQLVRKLIAKIWEEEA